MLLWQILHFALLQPALRKKGNLNEFFAPFLRQSNLYRYSLSCLLDRLWEKKNIFNI